MDVQKLVADGGIKSRKLWLGVGCIIVLAAVAGCAARWAAVAGVYEPFVGGVVSLYAIFCGVDGAKHYANVKHLGAQLVADSGSVGPKDDDAGK